jgi:hypothetical protein
MKVQINSVKIMQTKDASKIQKETKLPIKGLSEKPTDLIFANLPENTQ